MPQTTIQYVLSRLRQLGVTDVFGVPGDFAFPITDAICEDNDLNFIGSCNEINAAYSADGYARSRVLRRSTRRLAPANSTRSPASRALTPNTCRSST
jgi:thiamine pyrophosphate-dependent acetolactate synthase large subunit-like protein